MLKNYDFVNALKSVPRHIEGCVSSGATSVSVFHRPIAAADSVQRDGFRSAAILFLRVESLRITMSFQATAELFCPVVNHRLALLPAAE